MKKLLIFMAIIAMIAVPRVYAVPVSGEAVLDKMDATMKAERKYMEEEMVLVTASGAERSRAVAVWNKNVGEEEMMLVRFLGPANVKGTGFLMKNDEMWLYLPALGKVKRIAGSAKQGSFMGSDLSYEDMEALGSAGFSATHQVKAFKETKSEGTAVYQLDLVPLDPESSYSKLEILVHQELYLPLQIIYHGRDGLAMKKLTTFEHQQVDGRWVAGRLQMEDLKKGSKTVLKVNKVDFNPAVDDSVFSTRYLERGI